MTTTTKHVDDFGRVWEGDYAFCPTCHQPLIDGECTHARMSERVAQSYGCHEVKPDFWLVAMDYTDHWMLPPEMMQHIKRIESVYVFDRNEVTHLCEFTPSYCLYLVENRAIFKSYDLDVFRDYDLDDHTRDAIDDAVRNEPDEDISYMHCHEIDAIIEKNEQYTVAHWGTLPEDYDSSNENETIDAILEDCRCNGRL